MIPNFFEIEQNGNRTIINLDNVKFIYETSDGKAGFVFADPPSKVVSDESYSKIQEDLMFLVQEKK